MKTTIALVNQTDKDDPVKLIDWPENVPLALPAVGDDAKYERGRYGKVVGRSFNYTDSLTVELRVEYAAR